MSAKNIKKSDAPTILERVVEIRWICIFLLVGIGLTVECVHICRVLSNKPALQLQIVNDLYEQAVYARNEAVRASHPELYPDDMDAAFHDSIRAQEKVNATYFALERQVRLLPKGEVPVRVTQFLSDGPAVLIIATDEGYHREEGDIKTVGMGTKTGEDR